MHLVIHRGNTFDRELELTNCDLRIGRAEQNDIVLPDRSQTVSRVHARLQCEDGCCVLTDLKSANGTWSAGRRVSIIPLEPGEPITLGPYNLVLQSDPTPSREATTSGCGEKAGVAHVHVAIRRPSQRGGPEKGADKGRQGKELGPGFIAYLARLPRPILFSGFAACMIVVMALGQIFAPARRSQATTLGKAARKVEQSRNTEVVQQYLAQARLLLERNDFDDGIKQLDQALFVEPHNAEALELKMKANEMKAAGPRTESRTILDAETNVASPDDTTTVRSRLTTVPQTGRRPRLADHGMRAVDRVDPSGSRGDRTSKQIPQIVRRSGEGQALWYARDRETQKRYDLAKSALENRAFTNAVALLTGIERDEPQYKDVSALLAQAQEGQHSMARQALEAAAKLEAAGELPDALKQYDAVQQLDSSTAAVVEDSRLRLGIRMRNEAADAIARAKQYDAYGQIQKAVPLYERAYGYLPEGDPNKKAVKDRLEVLGVRQ